VQVGFNRQIVPGWVAGVEADIGWLGIDRTRQNWNAVIAFGVETDWYATARVRLARSTGPALLYVTGGAAFVDVTNRYNVNLVGRAQASKSEVATGWTIGGGIEAVLGNGWTGKTEYLYIDAGSQDVFNVEIGGGTIARFDNRFHVFRFGVNRKFGG
jgi:outer membrane immunogenic protein